MIYKSLNLQRLFSIRKIQIIRWNAIKTEKAKFHKRYPFLLPKSYKDHTEIPPPVIKNNLPSANVNCQVIVYFVVIITFKV